MQLYQLSFPNGKKYIGITSKTAEIRFKRHCFPSQNKNACQKAIHKYGKENVVLTVLATVDNWELLCLAEIEAIEKYKTFGKNGYNTTLGGEGRLTIDIHGEERIFRDKKWKSEYSKHYQAAKKVEIAEQRKAFYASADKVEIAAKNKVRYLKEKERILAQKKAYSIANKEKISAKNKARYAANKVELAAKERARYAAKKLLSTQAISTNILTKLE